MKIFIQAVFDVMQHWCGGATGAQNLIMTAVGYVAFAFAFSLLTKLLDVRRSTPPGVIAYFIIWPLLILFSAAAGLLYLTPHVPPGMTPVWVTGITASVVVIAVCIPLMMLMVNVKYSKGLLIFVLSTLTAVAVVLILNAAKAAYKNMKTGGSRAGQRVEVLDSTSMNP